MLFVDIRFIEKAQKRRQKMNVYDLIVIGGGPGGYHAAFLAGKAGLSTLIVEKQTGWSLSE